MTRTRTTRESMCMKTLEIEQITALQEQHAALIQTARAGAKLASFCRGAIRGLDAVTDPDGRTTKMLVCFLEMAGFEVGPDNAQ